VKESNKKVWNWDRNSISENDLNGMDKLMIEFLRKNFTWVSWHRKIAGNEGITVDEAYEDERSIDIDYLKVVT